MANTIDDVLDIILGKINQICGKFGLNNIMAQLYVILYLNNKAMSLSEMTEKLKMSKGSISINIRALERYGVVRKVWIKGTRQDYYEAEYDIAKVAKQRVKSMVENRFSEIEEMILSSTQMLAAIEPRTEEERQMKEVFRAKIEKIKNLYEQAKQLFNLFGANILNIVAAANGDILKEAASGSDNKVK